jgi:hypothetical protein
VANALAYYNTATIIAVKCFIVQAPDAKKCQPEKRKNKNLIESVKHSSLLRHGIKCGRNKFKNLAPGAAQLDFLGKSSPIFLKK